MAFATSNTEGWREAPRPPFMPFPGPNASASASASPQCVTANLTSLFECPVCRDYALPPIHQCENGHIVCGSCLRRLTRCALCEKPAGKKIRNLAMEKLALLLTFPCKYELFGCAAKLSFPGKLEHELVCDYRPCPCILGSDSCAWQGTVDEVLAHIDKRHTFVPKFQGEFIVISAGGFNRPEPFGWVALQFCFGRVFVVQMRKYHHRRSPLEFRFFVALQLVGSRSEAQKFACRIELRNQTQRLALDATLRTVHDGIDPLQCCNGIVLDMDTVKVFADGSNLNMGVSVFQAGMVSGSR